MSHPGLPADFLATDFTLFQMTAQGMQFRRGQQLPVVSVYILFIQVIQHASILTSSISEHSLHSSGTASHQLLRFASKVFASPGQALARRPPQVYDLLTR